MTDLQTRSTIAWKAENAARVYTRVAECCPYPADSAEGRIFKQAFEDEREWLTRGNAVNPQAPK